MRLNDTVKRESNLNYMQVYVIGESLEGDGSEIFVGTIRVMTTV